jgi:hypothetical protein
MQDEPAPTRRGQSPHRHGQFGLHNGPMITRTESADPGNYTTTCHIRTTHHNNYWSSTVTHAAWLVAPGRHREVVSELGQRSIEIVTPWQSSSVGLPMSPCVRRARYVPDRGNGCGASRSFTGLTVWFMSSHEPGHDVA